MVNENKHTNLPEDGDTLATNVNIVTNLEQEPVNASTALDGKNPLDVSQKTTKDTIEIYSDQDKVGPSIQHQEPDSEKQPLMDSAHEGNRKHTTE